MLHLIGTIVVWYVAIVVGVWAISWALAGAVIFSRQLAYVALALAALTLGAWLFSLNPDQLQGLAIGSSILVFVVAAPCVAYRVLQGGRSLDQDIAHKLKKNRKAMGYDT